MGIEHVVEESRRVAQLARDHGKRSHVWIQCYAVPRGREGELREACRLAAAESVDVLAAWGYRGEIGTYEPCEDCGQSWRQLGLGYADVLGGGGPRL